MKFFCFALLFICQLSFASQSKLLKCLGKEEKYIHDQKIGGAFYQLNSSMISYMVMFPDDIIFKSPYLEEICQEKFSSFHLLRLFLTLGDKVIDRGSKVRPGLEATTNENISKNSLHMFVEFIGSMQAAQTKAGCLEKNIPQLKDFYLKTQHFETNVNYSRLVKELKNIDVIFDKILSNRLNRDC